MAAKAEAGENWPLTHPVVLPGELIPVLPPPQASSSAAAGINASSNDAL
jgi:hypothetical protein